MRVELLLELSGLTRQESLVGKGCTTNNRNFEDTCDTLVEHYSGVHPCEGHTLGGSFQRHPAQARVLGRMPVPKVSL